MELTAHSLATAINSIGQFSVYNNEDKRNLGTFILDYMNDNDEQSVLDSESDSDSEEDVPDLEAVFEERSELDDSMCTDDCELITNSVGVGPDGDREMDRIRSFTCKCRQIDKENTSQPSCLKKFECTDVYKWRYEIAAFTEKKKDIFILGQLFAFGKRDEMTAGKQSHKVPQKRRRTHTNYYVKQIQICRQAFMFIHGIGKERLQTLQKHLWENGIGARSRKRGRTNANKHILQHEDVLQVVRFISNYAEDHAVVLPGRHPNQSNFSGKLLPSYVTKASVWRKYTDAMIPTEQRSVSLTSFKSIWRTLLPHIAATKPMSDLCWVCQKNNYQVFRSANLEEDVKCAKLKKQEQHLQLVCSERAVYNAMLSDAKDTLKRQEETLKRQEEDLQHLQHAHTKINTLLLRADKEIKHLRLGGHVPPASREMKMHYSFDFAQQVHYPSDPLQPGPMYFLTPRKCGLFGVCCEAIPQQVNYLVDEGMCSSKGSNAVISYLHHFFSEYGLGETVVDLHCDNCGGQNKNKFMLWYWAWRTLHHFHQSAGLHLLIAGHTKFSPDWCFGLVKQRFRKTRVNTLAEIAAVVTDSTVSGVNIPQLVGKEDGTVLVPIYNWQEYLSPYFKPLPNIKQYQHFSFDSKDPGVVVAKMSFDGEETRFQLLRDIHVLPPRDGLPVLRPPGLDSAIDKLPLPQDQRVL